MPIDAYLTRAAATVVGLRGHLNSVPHQHPVERARLPGRAGVPPSWAYPSIANARDHVDASRRLLEREV